MRFIPYIFILLFLSACIKGNSVDIVIHNAVIHSMNEGLEVYEAMAIKDGKIVELGPERQILNKYSAEETIDAGGKEIYPGLTDAHVHLILGAKQRMGLNLNGTKSFQQLLTELEIYQQRTQEKFLVGQGWNETQWGNPELPTNEKLNQLFPNTPVCLFRYDGHTALVNNAMLQLAKIDNTTTFENGEAQKINGQLTGIVTDEAMEVIKSNLPKYPLHKLTDKIIEIQNELLSYGITNVHDAGLEANEVAFYKQLIDKGRFKLNLYGMLLNTPENIEFAKKNGVFTHKNLTIRSFKLFLDGALGSRGAWLNEAYSDDSHTHGHSTISVEELTKMVDLCAKIGYQLNTHAIGDKAVATVIDAYSKISAIQPDHRWRIEHAQIIEPNDMKRIQEFGIIPSVQPTHATNDYLFAEQRLGTKRIANAYAYHTLLKHTGILTIGTDFPIEDLNPFKTIYAACTRKNEYNLPKNGFNQHESITLDECLQGMTLWSALASFQEDKFGRLDKGMDATFAIFQRPVTVGAEYQPNFALYTFINGKKVYSAE